MDKPKIIHNFISEQDISNVINYIDLNIEAFNKEEDVKNYTQRFGKDRAYPDSRHLEEFDHDIKSLITKYSDLFVKECKSAFNDEKIYPSEFWFNKRLPKTPGRLHTDVDDGLNSQLNYSGVIYLNTLEDSGHLRFPNIPFTYTPNSGDLVIFPSSGKTFSHSIASNNEDRYACLLWSTNDEKYRLF